MRFARCDPTIDSGMSEGLASLQLNKVTSANAEDGFVAGDWLEEATADILGHPLVADADSSADVRAVARSRRVDQCLRAVDHEALPINRLDCLDPPLHTRRAVVTRQHLIPVIPVGCPFADQVALVVARAQLRSCPMHASPEQSTIAKGTSRLSKMGM